MNLRIVITICFILLINCGGLAQDHERELALPTQLEALVEAQFPPTRCPGLSVAVASNNKVAFSKAFGLATTDLYCWKTCFRQGHIAGRFGV